MPGWWSNAAGADTLEFHVTPDGTRVDSLRLSIRDPSLPGLCGIAGISFLVTSPSGPAIEGSPCAFTWESMCRTIPFTFGWVVHVEFDGSGCDAAGTVDLEAPQMGCSTCMSVEFCIPTAVSGSTWGAIKALYK
jgi:hypothetical protein